MCWVILLRELNWLSVVGVMRVCMWEHGFSYPPGEPGHIHMVVADAVKQSRSDRGRLRPRPGTGIPSHKTKPIHGRGEITSVPL